VTVVEFPTRRRPSKPVVKRAAPIQWALLGALSDGQWWDFHALFERVSWTIPAGDAMARREAARLREWRRHFERRGEPVPDVVPPRKAPEDPTLALLKARMTVYSQRLAWLRAYDYIIYHPEEGRTRLLITEKGSALYAAYQEHIARAG
jgi:hypothetical protein